MKTRAGRYTSALLLISAGLLLFLDQAFGSSYLAYLLDWWPLLLISLGVEYLLLSMRSRNQQKSVKLDFGSIMTSMLITVIVLAAAQASSLNISLFKSFQFDFNPFKYANESGRKFEQGVTPISLLPETAMVVIENPNGNVIVYSGDVKEIEIRTVVYVSGQNAEEAQKTAEQSAIEYSGTGTLTIKAKGHEYDSFTGEKKPRMNLTVTFPAAQKISMAFHLINGSVEASGVAVKDTLNAHTENGSISVSEVNGNVIAQTTNGGVRVSDIRGDADLSTVNGRIAAASVTGDVRVDTTNGSVEIDHIQGNVKVNTTNGGVNVREAVQAVEVDTFNGGIDVSSGKVGGDWKLDSSIGALKLGLPQEGDYTVSGSAGFGSITSEFPFAESRHKVEGSVGSGIYQIDFSTNSAVYLHKILSKNIQFGKVD